MASSKLSVYNEALAHLGSRRLASLSEGRESRRVLDDAWTAQVRYCLERAPWPSAMRSLLLTYDPGINPSFGPKYAFEKPTDWLKTVEIAMDGDFRNPLKSWVDADGYWYADLNAIFVRFVSTDTSYGLDLSRWTPSFASYVAVRLALMSCKRITGSTEERNNLFKIEKEARLTARASEALNTPPVKAPMGSWVMSRYAGSSGSIESGSGGVNLGESQNGGAGLIDVTVDGGEI